LRLISVEQELRGAKLDGSMPDCFSGLVTSVVSPNSDLHASAEYRMHLLGALAKRAIATALAA
jgi:carbon-monoxide dehydrogenase medium subunit